MNKVTLGIDVRVDDCTAEWAIIASNEQWGIPASIKSVTAMIFVSEICSYLGAIKLNWRWGGLQILELQYVHGNIESGFYQSWNPIWIWSDVLRKGVKFFSCNIFVTCIGLDQKHKNFKDHMAH